MAGDKKEHREKKEWSYKPYEGSPSDKPKPDSKPEGADYHPRFHHGDAGEHKHPYEPRKDYKPSDKVGRKPRTDKDEESAKPSKPAKPAEAQEPPQPKEVKEAKEQQPKKTKGSKVGKPVAKFTASVPAGVLNVV